MKLIGLTLILIVFASLEMDEVEGRWFGGFRRFGFGRFGFGRFWGPFGYNRFWNPYGYGFGGLGLTYVYYPYYYSTLLYYYPVVRVLRDADSTSASSSTDAATNPLNGIAHCAYLDDASMLSCTM